MFAEVIPLHFIHIAADFLAAFVAVVNLYITVLATASHAMVTPYTLILNLYHVAYLSFFVRRFALSLFDTYIILLLRDNLYTVCINFLLTVVHNSGKRRP